MMLVLPGHRAVCPGKRAAVTASVRLLRLTQVALRGWQRLEALLADEVVEGEGNEV